MPNWTKKQQEAIEKDGTNIIVSAGAGSGKTAVLTERVIYKLQKGIKINELLILTFTNAAAGEMKDRIRKSILNHPQLQDNLDYLESAYITTFDAYTLSLIKKYSYLLNIDADLKIVDEGIITLLKSDIMDNIFDEYYAANNPLFNKLIGDLTIKNDTTIKSNLLSIINKIMLKSDPLKYLDSYIDTYFNVNAIQKYIAEYYNNLHNEITKLETLIMQIDESIYPDYYHKMSETFENLIKASSYDEIIRSLPIRLPSRPKNSPDLEDFKKEFEAVYNNFKKSLHFLNQDEIEKSFNILKEYLQVIIPIFQEFIKRLNNYKKVNDVYEFNDISSLAIKLLKENDYIREELKHTFKEILVDEYQDTNDVQEEFISLIQNNNVYMVGDIKQSIYGFRNANPQIFKDKYDKYSNLDGGIKIDLLENFRSRKEVIKAINEIFSSLMTNEVGGAAYKIDHQMNFGNQDYEENKTKQNYDLEILNYPNLINGFSKEETEFFIIAKDIIKKIKNHYQVFDKDSKKLRLATWKDFCIIMDRGKLFPLCKKIFEYLSIPLTIYEDKDLTNEIDTILINNIIGLILKIKDNLINTEFKYYFMSIARSFIFEYSDNTILKIIKDNSYENTDIYKIANAIAKDLDILSNYELLTRIVDDFNIYEAIIKIGNVEDIIIRLDNLFDIAKNLDLMGYTVQNFKEYMQRMLEDNNKLKYVSVLPNQDSVKIMNIHKSKGLEFPVCYFCGYYKEFNTEEVKNRYAFTDKYGIITPYFDEGLASSVLKDLFKNDYLQNNISEQVRLFYVSLTRAREKMIIVTNLDDDYELSYKSFLGFLKGIKKNLTKYIVNINLDTIGLTKDYLYDSSSNKIEKDEENAKIIFKELNIFNEQVETKKASKEVNQLISQQERLILQKGTLIHSIFEETNFLHVSTDNPFYKQINSLKEKLNITNDTLIYKEKEFYYEKDDVTYQGIIDLVLIDDNVIKIVDYKLKNIADEKYIEQLKVYYDYLKTIFTKKIETYLYSIMNDELREITMID